MLKIDPKFVSQWTLENLSGWYILGIPAEEIIWAWFIGALWAPVFEDIKGYKIVSLPSGFKRKLKPGQ